MRLVRLALEMEAVDEVVGHGIPLFFQDAFCNDSHEVRDIEDGGVSTKLLVNFVVVNPQDTNWTTSLLIFKLCLLDQQRDDIANCACLWRE